MPRSASELFRAVIEDALAEKQMRNRYRW